MLRLNLTTTSIIFSVIISLVTIGGVLGFYTNTIFTVFAGLIWDHKRNCYVLIVGYLVACISFYLICIFEQLLYIALGCCCNFLKIVLNSLDLYNKIIVRLFFISTNYDS